MKKLLGIFIVMALLGVSAPAMAVEWNFYGSARVATFYNSNDGGDSAWRNLDTEGNKDAELQWQLQGNSRFGAKVKADNVSGQIELGLKANGNADADVGTRRVYGVWDFGPGKFKVGKDYTPFKQFISGQIFDSDLGLQGIGTTYGGRPAQASLSFGGFEIAFIDPNVGQLSGLGTNATQDALVEAAQDALEAAAAAGDFAAFILAQAQLEAALALPGLGSTDGDVDKIFPKIEASWGMGFDTWNFGLQGGWQYYDIEDVVSIEDGSTNDIGVTSWTLGANVGFNFGPAYINAAGSYGVNVGNAGWNDPSGYTASGGFGTWDGDDGVDNVDTMMLALVAGLKVSEMLKLEAGGGWRTDDPSDAPDGFDHRQNAWAIYGQAVIAMAPGVYVIPEVGYYEYGDDFTDTDAGDQFYAGAKWQIDF
jgi:hypothetical protein